MSCTTQSTGPPGPMRSRPAITAPDNRHFQTPRANMSAGNFKPKYASGARFHAPEAKILNIQSKPFQTQKGVHKFMNMEMNHKIIKSEANHSIFHIIKKSSPYFNKPVMKKSSPDVNKLLIQKKKILTALKNKTAIQLGNVEKTPTAAAKKKLTKAMDTELPTKKKEENIPQNEITTAQNTHDNDISVLKNKVQENHFDTPTVTTEVNSTSAQDIKSQDIPKIKSASEIVQDINADSTQEEKLQGIQGDAKVVTSLPKKETAEQSKTETDFMEKYELDPLLARAVEEELQDIMIQVWQVLPDDPIDDGDRVAVEKLRNEAGDDLRRVLGLNITKRLLNVYNNLFIKMQFTCRPQIGCLSSFLKEYHIEKFKRIDKNSNTFAAQLETIEDYDRLCAVKELKCGEAKITVTQCYKFTQCPENLKTIYDDNYFYEDSAQDHKNNIQKPKVKASDENVVRPEKSVAQPMDKPEFQPKFAVTTEIQKSTHLEHNNSEDDKNKTIEESESNSKCIVTAEVQNTANLIENDSEDVKKESSAIDREATTDSSKIIAEDSNPKEKELTDNANNEKEISEVIANDKDIEDVIKDKFKNVDIYGDMEEDVPEYQIDEDDELDDEDILALMSEGVVLDECSGSED